MNNLLILINQYLTAFNNNTVMANKNQGNGRATQTPQSGTRSDRRMKPTAHSNDGQVEETDLETTSPNSLKMLFEKELKSIYNVEKQLIKALPEMAKSVSEESLKKTFRHHLEQTEMQKERLEKIFHRLRMDREDEKCLVMEAMIEEGKKLMSEFEEGPVQDAAAIISAQKIEHYEICAYGSLYELADVLGYHKIADILDRSLSEEEGTDRHLSNLGRATHDASFDLSDLEMHRQ